MIQQQLKMKNFFKKNSNSSYHFLQRSSFSSSNVQKYDAIIVGAGHNGLVCANYLAKYDTKMKIAVLERRHLIGGAASSEEVFPGYVFSRASYLLSLFRN